MNRTICGGLVGSDPLGYLAALGLLRIVARYRPDARLRWLEQGQWIAAVETKMEASLVDIVLEDVDRWREGHPALDFAENGERKVQDLKHPPADFRTLMRNVRDDPESAGFVASYATGVAVDGSGQTKPTSLHFTAGQQRFLDAVLSVRDAATRDDFVEALFGPWTGRVGPKDTRWRAASERSRALLSFDPSKEKSATVVGAVWLAFQGMPLLPTVPSGARVLTTGFTGRGKNEWFVWSVWTPPARLDEVAVLVGTAGLEDLTAAERAARGIARIYKARVVRSSQGYGNFSAAEPV